MSICSIVRISVEILFKRHFSFKFMVNVYIKILSIYIQKGDLNICVVRIRRMVYFRIYKLTYTNICNHSNEWSFELTYMGLFVIDLNKSNFCLATHFSRTSYLFKKKKKRETINLYKVVDFRQVCRYCLHKLL